MPTIRPRILYVSFFRLSPNGDTITMPLPYSWVWAEGDALRAGPGPEFGNDDPGGTTLAVRRDDGRWYLPHAPMSGGFTDFDIRAVL